jgi:hypothetical protein
MKSLIQRSNYFGSWYSVDMSPPHTFEKATGFIVFGFSADTTWAYLDSDPDNKFYIHVYDGQYVDKRNLHFSFPPDNSLPNILSNNG